MKQLEDQKCSEIAGLNDKMLEMNDEKLDLISKLENNDGIEHNLKQEICKLMDTISGKDMAIAQLSDQMVQGEKERAKLSDMLQTMRNKMIIEQSFSTNFAAVKTSGLTMGPIKNN